MKLLHLNIPRDYRYKGWWFEYTHSGPWPLKKNGEPRKRAGRKFYKIIEEFEKEQKAAEILKQIRTANG